MSFNLEQWKESIRKNLHGWKGRMERTGVNSLYYFLAGVSLLPVVQAVHSGDWSGLAVLGASVDGAVSTGLLANVVQKAKDKSDKEVAGILETEVKSSPELKAEIDAMLEKLETLQEAGKALADADKEWFAKTIQGELKKVNSGIQYEAQLIGNGAIAQGNGSVAVGAGAKYVAGDYYESPDRKQIESDKDEAARRAYLERMRRHCQVLPLAALGGEEGAEEEITLDHVYIDLDTTLSIKKSELEALRAGKQVRLTESMLGKEMPELLERSEGKKDIEPLPVLDAVRATPRVVLLGDPGAGKSTFARKLLGLQAAVMLKQCEPLNGIASNLLPMLIVLRELSAKLSTIPLNGLSMENQRKELLKVIAQHLADELQHTSVEAATGLVANALEEGNVLLVLDGLDEVPQNLRSLMRQAVAALLVEYRIQRLLITSRIRSYVGNAVFENIPTFTIRPFDQEKIKGFVNGWYRTQTDMGRVAERDRQNRANDLIRAAVSKDLRELSSNPMMLTSMAIIHQKEIGLPRERVRLYKLVVDVLIRKWQKHKQGDQLTPSPELAAFLMDELRLLNALERLAYEAHRSGSGSGKAAADLPRLKALEILEGREYLNRISLAEEFMDYVDQRAGLLKGNGGELEKPTSYSFPHRIFQEYLAGCYMIRERNPEREYFPRAAEGDTWSLAAQLGAEELYFNRRGKHTVLDLAYQLLPDHVTNEQEARAALWSGWVARIAGVQEIKSDQDSLHGGEKYLALLSTKLVDLLQSGLSSLERAEAGRVLAVIGDPREEVLKVEAMRFCHVPAGEFLMGEGKEQHRLMLPEFWMAQYPVTNAQFGQFVQAGGYAQARYWPEAKKANIWRDGKIHLEWAKEIRDAPDDFGEPFNCSNHPVVGITWYEALAFTRWLDEKLRGLGKIHVVGGKEPTTWGSSIHVALPSEAEWEKAARGTDGREYPWEGKIDSNKANMEDSGIGTTSAVGCFAKGASPYGLQDMSGNVWEWTRTNYETGKDDFQSQETRVLRGGSCGYEARYVRCAYRYRYYPGYGDYNVGFRVVVSHAS
jgi:formylglycine-generating enzyme required for sulfatase activity